MKIVKVACKDLEDGDVLNILDDLSRVIKVTAIRIPKDINLNFSGRAFQDIEQEVGKLLFDADRLFKQAKQAKDYLKSVKSQVLHLQKQIL